MAAPASDWLRHFLLLLWNRWMEFNETWQEAKISTSSTQFVFYGPIGKIRWPPWNLIGWDIFDFSSETVEQIQRNLTGSKIWTAWRIGFPRFAEWPLKPQSDIRCNRFATSPRLAIYTNRRGRNKVPDRSRRGCREVGDWSGTSLWPNQSQPGFCACTKTWLRLIWSQTGPGKVADQSPISRRLVADRSPTNFVRIGAWLSLKLVGDWSATSRRLIGDWSATSLQLVGDLSAICSKMYSIS